MLEQVVDPKPDAALASDDAAFRWEKCSAWTRSSLTVTDHLIVWANIVAPQKLFEGMVVQNPPRPYFTLARAGLESAAQAVWALKEKESAERVHRHLRLQDHDLRQMAIALEMQNDDRAPSVREHMNQIRTRIGDAYAFRLEYERRATLLRYGARVCHCGQMQPDDLEVL